MSEVVVCQTYGGLSWTPQYVEGINKEVCLGCGRCVKLCVQECLGLESFEDDEGTERYVAKIVNKDQCIGCRSCGKICVRHAYSFKAKSA